MLAGGAADVVPTGGLRVPEGLEAYANWQDLPLQPERPQQPHCGPLCALVTEYRAKVEDMKRDLTRVVPAVKTYIYTAENGDQDRTEECKAHMHAELSAVEDRAETAKKCFLSDLEKAEENEGKVTDALTEATREKVRSEVARSLYSVDEAMHDCIRLCKHCMDNTYPSAKDRFGNFNLKLGLYTRKLFREQRKLLDLIKLMKKEKGVGATTLNDVCTEGANEKKKPT